MINKNDHMVQSVPKTISPIPLSSKISFGLVKFALNFPRYSRRRKLNATYSNLRWFFLISRKHNAI